MRKALTILLLFAALAASGQNASRIRRDAAYLSSEGHASSVHAADSIALAGLSVKISAQAGLSEAVGATYLEDLRNASSRIVEGRYTVLRYLPADRMGDIFLPRRERILQLVRQAEQTGDPQYYSIAYALARSLPAYPADLLASLRQKSTGSWTLQDFVSREADSVLAALEPKPAATPKEKPTKPASAPRKEPEAEHITVRDTVITERDLGRIEVEHTFSRRDTVVVIPGSREKGTTRVPLQKTTRPRASRSLHGFALAEAGVFPDLSYALLAGLGGPRTGGYLRAESNFQAVSPAYDCLSDGSTGYGVIWTSGARKVSCFSFTGGLWYACTDWLTLRAGAGYGQRIVCWQDTQGAWARVRDYSVAGLAVDTGLVFRIGNVALSLGGGTIAFRHYSFSLGVGFAF